MEAGLKRIVTLLLVLATGWIILDRLPVGLILALATGELFLIALLCELRIMRFENGWKWAGVEPYLYLLAPILASNTALAMPAPAWFPTPHALWAAIPCMVFAVASLTRGWIGSAEPDRT
jgi:hypothetical protein